MEALRQRFEALRATRELMQQYAQCQRDMQAVADEWEPLCGVAAAVEAELVRLSEEEATLARVLADVDAQRPSVVSQSRLLAAQLRAAREALAREADAYDASKLELDAACRAHGIPPWPRWQQLEEQQLCAYLDARRTMS